MQRHTSKKREPLRPSKTWGSLVAALQRSPPWIFFLERATCRDNPEQAETVPWSTHRKCPRDPAQLVVDTNLRRGFSWEFYSAIASAPLVARVA